MIPPWVVSGAAALVVGAVAAWQVNDAFDAKSALNAAKAETKAAVQVIQRVERANQITADVGRRSAQREVEIRTVFQDVVREVPTYVTVEADRHCDVPAGFVRLHDAAAAGSSPPTVPDPAATPHDAPSGVALSTVAGTVVANYGQCRIDQERLVALQEWVAAQARAWDQK